MEIRRLTVIKDVIYFEGGLEANKPVTRVAACAVIANPLAGRAQDDVEQLILGASARRQREIDVEHAADHRGRRQDVARAFRQALDERNIKK